MSKQKLRNRLRRVVNKAAILENFKSFLDVEIEVLDGVVQLALVLVLLVPAGEPPAVQGVVGDRGDGAAQVDLWPGLVQTGQVEGGHVGEGGGVDRVVESDHGLVLLHPAPRGPGLGGGDGSGGVAAGTPRPGLGHIALGVCRERS